MNAHLQLILLWMIRMVCAFNAPHHYLLKKSSLTLDAQGRDLPEELIGRVSTYLKAREKMKLPPVDLKEIKDFKERAKYGEKSFVRSFVQFTFVFQHFLMLPS